MTKSERFSNDFVNYEARIFLFSKKIEPIPDTNKTLENEKFDLIVSQTFYDKNSMNFINPYNDSIAIVFSFPHRFCIAQNFISYIDNFSNSKQYILKITDKIELVDSMLISHETRVIPPMDCLENEKEIVIPRELK